MIWFASSRPQQQCGEEEDKEGLLAKAIFFSDNGHTFVQRSIEALSHQI